MNEFLRENLSALWREWWPAILCKMIELGIIIAYVIENKEELIKGRVEDTSEV